MESKFESEKLRNIRCFFSNFLCSLELLLCTSYGERLFMTLCALNLVAPNHRIAHRRTVSSVRWTRYLINGRVNIISDYTSIISFIRARVSS